jgi:hypothetical protein
MSADTAPSGRSGKSRLKDTPAYPIHETTETAKRASDSLNQIASECAAICSDDIAAAIETSSQSAKLFTELSRAYVEACTASAQTYVEIGREAMSCRTPADVVRLQKRAMEGLNESAEATARIYSGVFETWSKAMDPFVARITDGPQRLFRAFAE